MPLIDSSSVVPAVRRVRTWYAVLLLITAIFGVRLFYVQVIRYDHYKLAALHDQLHQKEIPASRGVITAHDGDTTVPVVLNQQLYTIFADPVDIKTYKTDTTKLTAAAAKILGGSESDYKSDVTAANTRYSIMARRVSKSQRDQLMGYKFAGLYSEEQDYRTYPQGSLASQLLGFVDNNGSGQYGIEQALNTQLSGTAGQLKAITDLNGVPLAASKGNVETPAKNGDNVLLTVNLGMQAQLETILSSEYQKTKSKGLSAVIMDPNTGQIKAMANYPTYDPSHYDDVSDPNLFQNSVVSNAIEPGSTMKILTTAAALNQGVITPTTSFFDPAHWIIDGFNITDIEEDGGARNQTIATTLNLSLNTGATWMLMQMGGGQVNQKARSVWYDYMANHFLLGQATGVEQGYESAGLVPKPQDNGAGINLTYANTSFGQAVLITPLQLAAAYSSVLNGGTYYQPYLVDSKTESNGKTIKTDPKILKKDVVSPQVSKALIPLMDYVVDQHYAGGFSYLNFSDSYNVGGKTGTAQIANPAGGYFSDKFNGTYAGFVGGDNVQYVVVVYNTQPSVSGYAGSNGGQPVFGDIAHMLIDDGYVAPKK